VRVEVEGSKPRLFCKLEKPKLGFGERVGISKTMGIIKSFYSKRVVLLKRKKQTTATEHLCWLFFFQHEKKHQD